MPRVNYYESAFNSQKEKRNIMAEMLKISKSGRIFSSTLSLQELLSELTMMIKLILLMMKMKMMMKKMTATVVPGDAMSECGRPSPCHRWCDVSRFDS